MADNRTDQSDPEHDEEEQEKARTEVANLIEAVHLNGYFNQMDIDAVRHSSHRDYVEYRHAKDGIQKRTLIELVDNLKRKKRRLKGRRTPYEWRCEIIDLKIADSGATATVEMFANDDLITTDQIVLEKHGREWKFIECNHLHHAPPVREGGCLCGDVRYRTSTVPLPIGVCHCRDCQRRSGSAFGISAYFKKEFVEILRGTLVSYEYSSDNDHRVTKKFCRTCGSTISGTTELLPGYVSIAVGTFDDTLWVSVHSHHFVRSAHRWLCLCPVKWCNSCSPF